MTERLIEFGPEKRLRGVLSPGAATPPILLFNSGVVHRIGPHRGNVRLARAFNATGRGALRFDLSGQGDSARGRSDVGFAAQAVEDMRAAVDAALDALGGTRVALVGLCSGTDVALDAASADDRICGVALLDPWAYPSPGAGVRRLIAKASDPRIVARRLSRFSEQLFGDRTPAKASAPQTALEDTEKLPDENPDAIDFETLREQPSLAAFAGRLSALTASGAHVHISYSSLERDLLTTPEHVFETLRGNDFHGRLTVDVDLGATHTYTELASQAALAARLTAWAETLSEARR